jgi:hypothetical protein
VLEGVGRNLAAAAFWYVILRFFPRKLNWNRMAVRWAALRSSASLILSGERPRRPGRVGSKLPSFLGRARVLVDRNGNAIAWNATHETTSVDHAMPILEAADVERMSTASGRGRGRPRARQISRSICCRQAYRSCGCRRDQFIAAQPKRSRVARVGTHSAYDVINRRA